MGNLVFDLKNFVRERLVLPKEIRFPNHDVHNDMQDECNGAHEPDWFLFCIIMCDDGQDNNRKRSKDKVDDFLIG
jgi:hypothetical protein